MVDLSKGVSRALQKWFQMLLHGPHQVAIGFGFKFDLHTLHTGTRIKVRTEVKTFGAEVQAHSFGV